MMERREARRDLRDLVYVIIQLYTFYALNTL